MEQCSISLSLLASTYMMCHVCLTYSHQIYLTQAKHECLCYSHLCGLNLAIPSILNMIPFARVDVLYLVMVVTIYTDD